MKFRIYFDVTFIADEHTYVDEEYWIDGEYASVLEAKTHAFAEFVNAFMVKAERVPVLQKIVLNRIENRKTKDVTQISLTEEDF